jgi:hypothetical protein
MSPNRSPRSSDAGAHVGLSPLKRTYPEHAITARDEVHPLQVRPWKQETARLATENYDPHRTQ